MAHVDWLIELTPEPNPNNRTVATWRLGGRADYLSGGQNLQAEAIAPHRAFYLDLLAPRQLSGGRGLVYPLARGTVCSCRGQADGWQLEIAWARGRQQLKITADDRVFCLANSRWGAVASAAK